MMGKSVERRPKTESGGLDSSPGQAPPLPEPVCPAERWGEYRDSNDVLLSSSATSQAGTVPSTPLYRYGLSCVPSPPVSQTKEAKTQKVKYHVQGHTVRVLEPGTKPGCLTLLSLRVPLPLTTAQAQPKGASAAFVENKHLQGSLGVLCNQV